MKKRIIGIITAMTMLISAMPLVITSAEEDITIANLSELESFRDNVNSGDTYEGKIVTLTADIDMSDKYGEGKELWESIGTEEHPFNGSFTGTGHTINVCIDTGDISDIIGGLFGYTDENAVIANLAVSGSVRVMGTLHMWRPVGSPGYVGAIVGNNKGIIKNCLNTADVTYMGNYGNAGGIAGKTEGSIINCYNTGNIKIMSSSGSNISETEDTSLIQNCFYLSESEMSDGKGAHGRTAEEFASGEVTYLLNGQKSEGDIAWYQNIGEDDFPTLDNTHSAVLFDGEKYYNNKNDLAISYGDLVMNYDKNTQIFTVENKSDVNVESILYTAVYSAWGEPRYFFRREIDIPAEGLKLDNYLPLNYSKFFLWDKNMRPLAEPINIGDMSGYYATGTMAHNILSDEYTSANIDIFLSNQRFEDDYELLFDVKEDNEQKFLDMLSEYIQAGDNITTIELNVYEKGNKISYEFETPHKIKFFKSLHSGVKTDKDYWGSNYRVFFVEGDTYEQLEVSSSNNSGFDISSDKLGTFVIIYNPIYYED